MILEDGEEKADQLGTSRLEKWHGHEFPGFLFASYSPDLEPKKPATQKGQQEQTKKKRKEKPAFSLQRKRTGAVSKDRKLLDNNRSFSQIPQKRLWPHSHSRQPRPGGQSILPPLWGCIEVPPPPPKPFTGVQSEKAKYGPSASISTGLQKHPSSPREGHWRLHGEQELPFSPSLNKEPSPSGANRGRVGTLDFSLHLAVTRWFPCPQNLPLEQYQKKDT